MSTTETENNLNAEKKPGISWREMREKILEATKSGNGLVFEDSPTGFEMSVGIMAEIARLRTEAVFVTDSSKLSDVTPADKQMESGRIITTDPLRTKLLITTQNQGTSERTLYGARRTYTSLPNQIGSIHTHPADELPNVIDLAPLLTRDRIFEIVVTPERVVVVFRTTRTQTVKTITEGQEFLFSQNLDRFRKLVQADKARGREIPAKGTDFLFLTLLQSMDNLSFESAGFATYEARLGSARFIRLTQGDKLTEFYRFIVDDPEAAEKYIFLTHPELRTAFIQVLTEVHQVESAYSEELRASTAQFRVIYRPPIEAHSLPEGINKVEIELVGRYVRNGYTGRGKRQYRKFLAIICSSHPGVTFEQLEEAIQRFGNIFNISLKGHPLFRDKK